MNLFHWIRFSLLFSFLFLLGSVHSQDYAEAWKHINHNERDSAMAIIGPKVANGSATVDEFLTNYYIKVFNGQETEIKDFENRIYTLDNPYPYIYALWFGTPVAGDYGLKQPHQLSLLNRLTRETPGNGTLRASAQYQFNHYYIKSRQFDERLKGLAKIGALHNWQFVGPFNNLSGSGFNKDYAPVSNASGTSVFTSATGASIKWFTPKVSDNEGWVAPRYFIESPIGNISFAQTFVFSPLDQEVNLCTGTTGTLKVWVNDQLHVSVSEERVSEMDSYSTKCSLRKGYNRILVQVGSEEADPNFIIRLVDGHFEPVPGLTHTSEYQEYPIVGGTQVDKPLPLFAEEFFLKKIKAEPDNLLNYLLLNDVYLRNEKVFQARGILEQALAQAPDNSILKFQLILCYIKEGNRTAISALYEEFSAHDPESLFGYLIRIEKLKDIEKYQEVLDLVIKQEQLYGKNVDTYNEKMETLAKLNKVPELLALVEEAYKLYPHHSGFAEYAYLIEQKINKDSKQAIKVLENYQEKYYDYSMSNLLIQEYFTQQSPAKAYRMLEEQIDIWPFDVTLQLNLLREYASQQRYQEAYALCNRMLQQMPYSGNYNDNKGTIEELLGMKSEAILSYKQALRYKPTLYSSREKLQRLEGKESLLQSYTDEQIAERSAATGKEISIENIDYYFILDDKQVILYPEGGREDMMHVVIKVVTDRGIDNLKELTLPYSSSTEELRIDEAVLMKPNGTKVKPEINDNYIVWTGMEAGDIIYCAYKIRSYLTGKFGVEYYDHHSFEGGVPTEDSKYTLILPASRKFYYETLNGSLSPTIREQGDYKIYEWQKRMTAPTSIESYMPEYVDIATTLHISTLPEWNDIALWYRDVVYSKLAIDNDYEVMDVYNRIFKGQIDLSPDEKARRIYEYIASNINYSSVSFRQSNIIPQRASKTISTRLGDCKDISTLFVSLANLAGLEANLVLVSTRDNGIRDMYLPSFLFNHCIVKYKGDQDKTYFLELTDRNLPFRSLPYTLFQAMSLTIPALKDKDSGNTLVPIDQSNKTDDVLKVHSDITFTDLTMNMEMEVTKYGALSATYREDYRSMNKENTLTLVHQLISKFFENPVTVNEVSFTALEECADSIRMNARAAIKNEVKKIGSLYAISIPFIDAVFTSDPFNTETRTYDFEYWDYENVDRYETEINILLPDTKSFAEVPEDKIMEFNGTQYSISFKLLQPNQMKVVRRATINKDNIPASEFAAFKNWALGIMEIENTYITFK